MGVDLSWDRNDGPGGNLACRGRVTLLTGPPPRSVSKLARHVPGTRKLRQNCRTPAFGPKQYRTQTQADDGGKSRRRPPTDRYVPERLDRGRGQLGLRRFRLAAPDNPLTQGRLHGVDLGNPTRRRYCPV